MDISDFHIWIKPGYFFTRFFYTFKSLIVVIAPMFEYSLPKHWGIGFPTLIAVLYWDVALSY